MAFKIICPECKGKDCSERGTVFHCCSCNLTIDAACNFYKPCPGCQGSGHVRLIAECKRDTRTLAPQDVEILEIKYAMTAAEIVTALHTSKTKFSLVGQDVQLVPAKKG